MLLLLALCIVVACAQRIAWIDPPVVVADGRSVRLDIQTSSILLRARITRLVVCSAVDQPMMAYDGDKAEKTGCSSPGYTASQVYPASVSEDKYHVRQRAMSMYLKRRLFDPHSPTVWLQATLEVRDERSLVAQVLEGTMVRFQVPERALDIGQTIPAPPAVEEGLAERVLQFLHLRSATSEPDQLDYDVLDAREDLHNGTSTHFYRHVHWSVYSAVLFGSLFVLAMVAAAAVCRVRVKRSDISALPPVYEMVQNQRIARWVSSAASRGLYHHQEDQV